MVLANPARPRKSGSALISFKVADEVDDFRQMQPQSIKLGVFVCIGPQNHNSEGINIDHPTIHRSDRLNAQMPMLIVPGQSGLQSQSRPVWTDARLAGNIS